MHDASRVMSNGKQVHTADLYSWLTTDSKVINVKDMPKYRIVPIKRRNAPGGYRQEIKSVQRGCHQAGQEVVVGSPTTFLQQAP